MTARARAGIEAAAKVTSDPRWNNVFLTDEIRALLQAEARAETGEGKR
jgi:hypothetical protein